MVQQRFLTVNALVNDKNTIKRYLFGGEIVEESALEFSSWIFGKPFVRAMKPPAVAGDSHPGLSPSCEHRAIIDPRVRVPGCKGLEYV